MMQLIDSVNHDMLIFNNLNCINTMAQMARVWHEYVANGTTLLRMCREYVANVANKMQLAHNWLTKENQTVYLQRKLSRKNLPKSLTNPLSILYKPISYLLRVYLVV